MSRGRGIAVLLGIVAVIVVLVATLGGSTPQPYDLSDAGDTGYKGLRDVLGELGTTMDELDATDVGAPLAQRLPIVLVADGSAATPEQAERLRRYAEAGGIVVGAGPIGGLGAAASERMPSAFPSGQGQHGTCDLEGFDDVWGFGVDDLMVPLTVPEGAQSCFGDGRHAALVSVDEGVGRVVTVASPDLFTNLWMRPKDQEIDDPKSPMPDDVVLAVRLLTPEEGRRSIGVVTSGLAEAAPSTGSKSLSDLLSPGVKLGLGQLLVAFVLYAAWRARRDGRLVAEPLPVEIAGSELVSATGSLMQRQHDPGAAATVLRRDARRVLQRRLGLPAEATTEALANEVSTRTGRPLPDVIALIADGPVADDASLITLSHGLDQIAQEVS